MLLAAGELPAAEAARLRARIEQDASLRDQWEGLVELEAGVDGLFAEADAAEPLPQGTASRARAAAEVAVRQWVAESQAPAARIEPGPVETAVWRYARWPLAAAASVVIGLIIWTFASEPTGTPRVATDYRDGLEGGRMRPAQSIAIDETPGGSEFMPMERHFGQDRATESVAVITEDTEADLVAALFDNPAGRWEVDGDEAVSSLDLVIELDAELAALQAITYGWEEDGL